MFKFAAPLVIACALFSAACSSNYNKDEVPDISPDALYLQAQTAMTSGDYYTARQYLEAIDSRYPFGELADQVQLDLIYVYYKTRESALTTAQINRFLRLSPTSPHIDYVLYMKGLNEMQMRSDILQDFLGLNRSQKDPTHYYEAFNTFREMIETYPNSAYAADAYKRMIYIQQQLAEREYKIASYYYDKQAYVSAIRHCQNILYSYRNTPFLEDALQLMSDCYRDLGLEMPAQNTDRVEQASFADR
ncbi:MAG: outer membrane protein assembly factor BamD [Candidatus Anaerobiospirillum merdipullorum]|uniref:Outer membrane protein assembly factor BamD n=1 Tax=Candidatus Anaerobiospirillum merdipullorum TaxID=2838450 RepID=A0A9E2KNI4_9GAMM|nr:outer membrane protein assembly factor BamD [Candidatus Anaerobiospirillum merdipullorum]